MFVVPPSKASVCWTPFQTLSCRVFFTLHEHDKNTIFYEQYIQLSRTAPVVVLVANVASIAVNCQQQFA